ncbi:hypothetical protein DFQ26_000289 [Actinomortierella ambigua]|nr:hypothetical protein DFQ26_000289 [Actinomortierella ambigua]
MPKGVKKPCSTLKGSRFILSGADVPPQTYLPQLLLTFAEVEFECQLSDGQKVDSTPPDAHLKHVREGGSTFELEDVKVITRYLARLLDLDGESAEEDAQLDMVLALLEKILRQWIAEVYSKPNPRDTDVFEKFLKNVTPALRKMEEHLVKNESNGHFVRNRITYLDIAYFELVTFFLDTYPKSVGTILRPSELPATFKLYECFRVHPRLSKQVSTGDPWRYHRCSRVLGLRDVGFLVRDIRRSLKFYTNNFGFVCAKKLMAPQSHLGYVEFDLPNTTAVLSLLSQEGQPEHQPGKMTQGPFSLIVKDVRSMLKEMTGNGVKVHNGPEEHSWGTLARILDPDNNVITIIDIKPGFE